MCVQKFSILEACVSELENRIKSLVSSLSDINDSLLSETKSSVGDKHETARARMQFEQNKLENQLKVIKDQLSELKRIDPASSHNTIGFGSLVTTNNGRFFVAIGFGKVIVDSSDVFVISQDSPLALRMRGMVANQLFDFNGRNYIIQNVF